MKLHLALALMTGAALPAAAEVAYPAPSACHRIATVQYDDCGVKNIFRCAEGEAAFYIESVDDDGSMGTELSNENHSTLRVDFSDSSLGFSYEAGQLHPQAVINAGEAQETIVGEIRMFGVTRPVMKVGAYVATGETVEISGLIMQRIVGTEELKLPPPAPASAVVGSALYNAELDLLVLERSEVTIGGKTSVTNLSALALTGQPGFGSNTPMFGCGGISSLSVPRPEDAA